MRFLRSLALVFVICTAALAQQPDQLYTATRNQLDVTKVLLAQQEAWNKGDLDGYVSRYKDAPDTQAILGGSILGFANIRSAYRINFPNAEKMGTLENSEVSVRELGPNFALATGKYHLMRSKKGGGEAIGTFTDVFEKTAAGWQLIFSENT